MRLLGGKWRLIIINFLRHGPVRFKELERKIGTISPKMLTSALEEMEKDGLVIRTVSQKKPLHVTYALTDSGKKASPIIEALAQFGLLMGQIHPAKARELASEY
jgi:DNA-binding HxlR family transcriptional regulator